MNCPNFTRAAAMILALAGTLSARAAEPAKLNYADHVRPIFREHCFTCHNQNKATNDLALDSYDRLMQGGASGKVIEAGDADSSYLWMLVSHQDQPHMPPKQDKLAEAKLDIIKKWINEGALKDAGAKAVTKAKPKLDLTASAGASRPAGPPIMPEGVACKPVVVSHRPGATTALAAAPWAPLAALAGEQQVVLYNSDTTALLGILPFPEGRPFSLRFSRSGALLVAGGGRGAKLGRVAVYDVKSGRRLTEVGDELDAVLACDISADQKQIALGGPQRIVRVFAVDDGRQLYEIHKHTDWILACEFSPDGAYLATADRSGGVRVWEADSGREFLNLEAHKAGVTAVHWRDDGKVFLSASEDGSVKLWEAEEGKQVRSFAAHPAGVTTAALAHDGRIVTGGRDKLVRLWDTTGKPLKSFGPMNDIVMQVTISDDGQRVIGGDFTGEVRVWTAADGKQVATLASNPAAK